MDDAVVASVSENYPWFSTDSILSSGRFRRFQNFCVFVESDSKTAFRVLEKKILNLFLLSSNCLLFV